MESAQKTLNVTTQRGVRTDNTKITRNFGTGDRMLKYKRINECFFTDTLFLTKKAGNNFDVTDDANYSFPIRVSFMLCL